MSSSPSLKRIAISDLTIGMFVSRIDGSWLDHSFWRAGERAVDLPFLTALRSSNVTHVWIDVGRGRDIAATLVASVSDDESQSLADGNDPGHAEHVAAVRPDVQAPVILRTHADPDAPSRLHASARKTPADVTDWRRARRIKDEARLVVGRLFDDAARGEVIDVASARPVVDDVISSVREKPGTLSSLVRLKRQDQYTYLHSVAVCSLMTSLALELGLDDDEVREAAMGGLLHDVGKMAVDINILNKPGKLTDDEFGAIKLHTIEGHRILLEAEGLSEVPLDICRHHHERTDGKGYPDGLAGQEISLFARMGTVCDVYDAITSDRPYKKAWEPAIALSNMAKWAEGAYDMRVFKAFVKAIGVYPNGSLVALQSKRLAVVIDQSHTSSIKPVVKTLWSTRFNQSVLPEVLRLDDPACDDRIVRRESAADWPIGDLAIHWVPQLD